MSATIYVVTDGEYSDYHICGVFSTKVKAEKYCADTREGGVEEWLLDAEAGKVKRTMFMCFMPDGECREYEQIDFPNLRTPKEHIFDMPWKQGFRADSYVSEEHARKLAIEEHQRRLREKA